MLFEIVFLTAGVFLLYTHVGYPLLLWVWAQGRARKTHTGNGCFEPTVSIVVVAYNEAERVEKRLENLLALDYPRERVEIILASDGSTDATVERARRYRHAGVRVIAFRERRGKSAVLNDIIPEAHGEIVVLADARQTFDTGALRALVEGFTDPEVGAISGELILEPERARPTGEGFGFYWKVEKLIRSYESRIDSTVGVSGAIYAIRRRLFEPIAPEIILDDVLIPMQIVRRGYRVTFEPAARAYDQTARAETEFARKVRTIAGNFQLFTRERWLLNPCVNRLFVQTVSHKVSRLLSPIFLGAVFCSNLLLLDRIFFRWVLGAQLAFYAAAIAGCLIRDSARKFFPFSVPYAFCLLNWAAVIGFLRFVDGRQRVTWERRLV